MRLRLASLIAAAGLAAFAAAAAAGGGGDVFRLSATAGPPGAGTPAAPVPKRLSVEATTVDPAAPRPPPVARLEMAAQGLIGFTRHFPSCTLEQASELELRTVLEACGRAQIGEGSVRAVGGGSDDRQDKIPCVLELRVFNLGRTAAVRLDRKEEADCLADPQTAIRARFRRIRIGGVPTDQISFDVPEALQRPYPGLETTIAETRLTLARRTRRIRLRGVRRRVGVVSSVGCGRRRVIRVRALDGNGAAETAETRIRC